MNKNNVSDQSSGRQSFLNKAFPPLVFKYPELSLKDPTNDYFSYDKSLADNNSGFCKFFNHEDGKQTAYTTTTRSSKYNSSRLRNRSLASSNENSLA